MNKVEVLKDLIVKTEELNAAWAKVLDEVESAKKEKEQKAA